MWAFKQWRGAVMIKEIINEAKPESCMSCSYGIELVFNVDRVTAQKWTTKHGYFLQMGGFKLACSQEEAYTDDMRLWLNWEALKKEYAYRSRLGDSMWEGVLQFYEFTKLLQEHSKMEFRHGNIPI